MAQTVLELVKKITEHLNKHKITSPKVNAETIIAAVLKCERWQIYQQNFPATQQIAKIWQITSKRADKVPLQYLMGHTWFFGRKFLVGNGALIPRPETELLVEKVLSEKNVKKVLEIGTGCGAIAICLKKDRPNWKITASDNSVKAIELAAQNIEFHQVELELVNSDVFENITGKFDIIVSNPPYISFSDYKNLPLEIKLYEPSQALLAKENGLGIYVEILKKAKEYLTKNGVLYFEIGENQADEVSQLACKYGKIEIFQDMNKRDRIMRIER